MSYLCLFAYYPAAHMLYTVSYCILCSGRIVIFFDLQLLFIYLNSMGQLDYVEYIFLYKEVNLISRYSICCETCNKRST